MTVRECSIHPEELFVVTRNYPVIIRWRKDGEFMRLLAMDSDLSWIAILVYNPLLREWIPTGSPTIDHLIKTKKFTEESVERMLDSNVIAYPAIEALLKE